jgi:hypothetical protein
MYLLAICSAPCDEREIGAEATKSKKKAFIGRQIPVELAISFSAKLLRSDWDFDTRTPTFTMSTGKLGRQAT